MSKYRIKTEGDIHGAISVHHAGNDQQYCEGGDTVTVKNQPTAGWGLANLYYKDNANNKTAITGNEFTMPNKDVTVYGEFKRFELDDWQNKDGSKPMKTIGSFTTGNLPAESSVGDIAYDTSDDVYKYWTGSKWVVMGATWPMEVRTTIGQGGIVPNVLYTLGEVGDLNITASATLETGKENTYHLIMQAGADFALRVPGEWAWEGGAAPEPTQNQYLRIDATVVKDDLVLASYHIY